MNRSIFSSIVLNCFFVAVLGCSGNKSSDSSKDKKTSVTGEIHRVGSIENFVQFEAPQRTDIIFMFDTSPSMRILWSEQVIKRGMIAWFDMMRTRAQNVPDQFDYFMYGSTPNYRADLSDDKQVVGGNGEAFFSGTTSSPEHGRFFIDGLNMISGFLYPPQVAVYDALAAILEKYPHHRRTVPMDIVYFGDAEQDKSTKNLDDVATLIKKNRKYEPVNFHIFIRSPRPGVSYCSTAEVLAEIEANYPRSGVYQMAQFRKQFNVSAYVLDRHGTHGCEGQPFQNVFEKFGAQSAKPLDLFLLGTNVIEGIVKVEINEQESPATSYQLQVDEGKNYYVKFLNGPPPGGSIIKVYYR